MPVNIGHSYHLSIGRSYSSAPHNPAMQKVPERTVWERVKEALREAGLPPKQEQAAKLLGIEQPSIALWNTPSGRPKLEHAVQLAKRLNVCVEWIYTERPPKRPGPPEDPIAEELWNHWGRLDDDIKQQIVGFAKLSARPIKKRAGG